MKKTDKECYIVYKVISPSNKIYIGITCETLESRISKHRYSAHKKAYDSKFMRAINKYGVENLEWTVIESELTYENAVKKEKYYIKKYDTYKTGYNSTHGGEGAFGLKRKRSVVEKQTELLRNTYWNNEEWKLKKSEQTKEYYRKNPEQLERLIKQGIKTLNRPDVRKKQVKAASSRDARIKSSKTRGCREFNVYNFITKQYIGTWFLKSECYEDLNLSNGKISQCLNGSRNHHKCYIFKYCDDPSVKGNLFNDEWLKSLKRQPNKKVLKQ